MSAVGTGHDHRGFGSHQTRRPRFRAIAVEPKDSPVITQTRKGEPLTPGPHKIQGTGAGFVPRNLNLEIVDDVITVTNEDAIATARQLASAGRHSRRHFDRCERLGCDSGGQAP